MLELKHAAHHLISRSYQLEAAGYDSPPPALQAALKVIPEFTITNGRLDLVIMANTKYLVTIEMKVPNSVSLMLGKESVKTVLNLHNAIARGRTGAGEILFNDKCKDLWGDAISHVKEAILSPEHALLVMELGQPCTNWTDADRRLAEQALDKLHARHILHGDLHSGNVVFVGEGDKRKARIIDLESARVYRGQDFDELAAKEKARVVRFGTATERARRYDK